MRHSCLLPTAALASVLLLSCNEPVGVTDPMQAATSSLPNQVDRFETPLVITFASGDPDIAALVGVSLEDFPAFCAGAEPEAVAEAMIVTHPDQAGGHVRARPYQRPGRKRSRLAGRHRPWR
jgi:hypothetical protein